MRKRKVNKILFNLFLALILIALLLTFGKSVFAFSVLSAPSTLI